MRYFRLVPVFLMLFMPHVLLAGDAVPAVQQIDAAVAKKAQWLKDAGRCPAALMPRRLSLDYLRQGKCDGNLAVCFLKCETGDGGSCYWLAYAVQQGGGQEQTSEALFQRSCKLGVASGCTNRAAGLSFAARQDMAAQRCAVRTYEKTCAADEPWGCTMYALHLTRGIGVKVDLDRALHALEKSCKYGKEDPACSNGTALRQEILQKQPHDGAGK